MSGIDGNQLSEQYTLDLIPPVNDFEINNSLIVDYDSQ